MADDKELVNTPAEENTDSKGRPLEYNAIYTMVDMKPKPSTYAHWAAHIIMAIIILIFCFMFFTATGRIFHLYGWSEGSAIAGSYQDHNWEQMGLTLDDYAFIYDKYFQYYQDTEDQYVAIGINNMDDMMDLVYQSMQSYDSIESNAEAVE